MASARLILLLAIVLVAVIVPILGADWPWKKTSHEELMEKLNKEGLPNEEVKKVVLSLRKKDENTLLGGYYPGEILRLAKGDGIVIGCQLDNLARQLRRYGHERLNLVLNVYNLANARHPILKRFCADNIKQLFQDKQRLAKLWQRGLSRHEIREILRSIELKEYIEIGELSVKEILDNENKIVQSIEDCHYYAIRRREIDVERVKDDDIRNLYDNLLNFDKASFEQLLSFCVENVEQILRARKEDVEELEDFARKFAITKSEAIPLENRIYYHEHQIPDRCSRLKDSLFGIEEVYKLLRMEEPDSFIHRQYYQTYTAVCWSTTSIYLYSY